MLRVLGPSLLMVSIVACAQDAVLQRRIEAMTREPAAARAHWGVEVTALDGTPLVEINEGQMFQPASNAKLFTTAAAMALLPMEERLRTQVIGDGVYTEDGSLEGELVVRGAGDANLSGRAVPYQRVPAGQTEPHRDELRYVEELADKVKAAGVTAVKGDVVGDDTLFPWDPYPAAWSIDDVPWYYGAPVSGLLLANGSLTMTVVPAPVASEEAQGAPAVQFDPPLAYYKVDMQARTGARGSKTSVEIQRQAGSKTIHVYGHVALDAKPVMQGISMDDPAEYAAMALKAELENRGVPVSGVARARHREHFETDFASAASEPVDLGKPLGAGALLRGTPRSSCQEAPRSSCQDCPAGWKSQVLAEHAGPPLYEDVVITNKASQNQHAELLLRQMGLLFGPATTAGGARVVRSFLTTKAGVSGDDFLFYDGSGLSGHDQVTPRAVTQLLRYAAGQTWGERWKASLPIGGVDGSLRSRFAEQPLKGRVFAKTGTLSETRALSGYLQCASGATVVFSILVNGRKPGSNADEVVMDRIVAAIAAAR